MSEEEGRDRDEIPLSSDVTREDQSLQVYDDGVWPVKKVQASDSMPARAVQGTTEDDEVEAKRVEPREEDSRMEGREGIDSLEGEGESEDSERDGDGGEVTVVEIDAREGESEGVGDVGRETVEVGEVEGESLEL